MSSLEHEPASAKQLEREAREWDLRVSNPNEWEDAPEAIPRASTSISLRMPAHMLSILKACARREGIGYQVLLKRWLDERIRQERDKIAMQRGQDAIVDWDIRGWRRLTAHDDPPLVAARNEFVAWLHEVPERQRTGLGSRLKSELDHPHLSARLEIFVHHHFAADGWSIQIEPALPHTRNRPDFLIEREGHQLLIECKSVFDETATAQQAQRLKKLADDIGRELGVTVMLEPLEDLPPTLPTGRIRNEIGARIENDTEVQEIDIGGEHQGIPYGIRAIVIRKEPAEALPDGVQGLISGAQTVTVGQRVREKIRENAGMYGDLDFPFLIAISVEMGFPARAGDMLSALFGEKQWNLHPSRQVTETREPDGLFTVTRGGDPRYARVSAVLVYRFKWLENGHRHLVHVYHNPYAKTPLKPELLPGIPQFVRLNDTQLGWVDGESDVYWGYGCRDP